MGKQYLVVEVIDPTSVKGTENIWVAIDDDPHAIENGFKSLRDSGQPPTGVFSRAYVHDDGTVERIEKFGRLKTFARDGFRTMSAMLRA